MEKKDPIISLLLQQSTLLARCQVCERNLDGFSRIAIVALGAPVGWRCAHCESGYSLNNELLELGTFGFTEYGIS